VKRYEVVYSWAPNAVYPTYYSAGEYRWKLTARMQAWTVADLGWDVKIIDRKTGKVLDGPKFNR
jgi:hypothetical protein